MRIKEIISLIEEYAPLKLQANFDNSGLLCGDPERELTSVLLCIDVTEEVVKEAIDKGHNLIISHHPLIFSGLKHITPATYVERCVINAIKHDITIYASTYEHGRGCQRGKRTHGRQAEPTQPPNSPTGRRSLGW